MLHQHVQLKHLQTWFSFPLAVSHTESTDSKSEQVLAQILKPHTEHLILVLYCHWGTISGQYFVLNTFHSTHSSSTPTHRFLDALRFAPSLWSWRGSSIKLTSVTHSLLPPLSPNVCYQRTSTWWGRDHMLCTSRKAWFVYGRGKKREEKKQPQLKSKLLCVQAEHGQSTHGYIHPWSISQQGPVQTSRDPLVLTVLMDGPQLHRAHLTHSHENSIILQGFTSGNAARLFPSFSHEKPKASSLETTKTSSVTPCTLHQCYCITPGTGKEWKWARVRYPRVSSWLLLLTQKFENNKQQTV